MIKVNLKKILKERKITLSEISEHTGISLKGLSAFQNNKTDGVKYHTIESICNYLAIDLTDLLKIHTEKYNIYIENVEKYSSASFNNNQEIYSGEIILENSLYSFNIFFKLNINTFMNLDHNYIIINILEFDIPKNLPYNLSNYINIKENPYNEYNFYKIVSYSIAQKFLYDFLELNIKDSLIINWAKILNSYTINNTVYDERYFSYNTDRLVSTQNQFQINLIPINPNFQLNELSRVEEMKIKLSPNFNDLVTIDNFYSIELNSKNERILSICF